ncbi:coadhesin [Aplysia californica]|uniref:Coadhesin n=1 Tax=Aplysia californica TaxID=6500 RepID=A0ABM1A280_APLCA|nr:coadhesin [Aplysia californica]
MVKCPVHGGWSLWSSYTLCSTTCGRGVRERSRSCDSPRPQYGGDKCDGPANQKQQCYGGKPCPVDGGWSSWTNFGYCRAPRCGRGYQIRSRSCSKPRPAHGGKPCPGQQYERIACHNDHDCPKNGSWCGWSQWNQCSSSCREDAPLQARQRICACPAPRNGGAECQGDSFQVQDCEGVPVCNPEEMSEEVEGASGGGDTDDEETEAETSSNSSSTKNSSSGETETTSKSMEDTRQAAEQVTQEYSAVTSEYSETERDEVDNTTTTVVNP